MKYFPKKLLAFLVAPAFLLSFTFKTDKVNFSGEWKLNEGKSELGDFGGRFVARSIKVEQKDDAITIAKILPSFNGGHPVTTTQILTFDGKESETTVFGGAKRKSTAKWSEDGQALTLNHTTIFEREGQTNEFKGTETWTMKDGALSIVSITSSPRGETTTKAIYNK